VTAYHEAFHPIYQSLSPFIRRKISNEIIKIGGDEFIEKSKLAFKTVSTGVSEMAADLFADYVRTKKAPSTLIGIFKWLLDKIKSWIGLSKKIPQELKNIFQDIYKGKPEMFTKEAGPPVRAYKQEPLDIEKFTEKEKRAIMEQAFAQEISAGPILPTELQDQYQTFKTVVKAVYGSEKKFLDLGEDVEQFRARAANKGIVRNTVDSAIEHVGRRDDETMALFADTLRNEKLDRFQSTPEERLGVSKEIIKSSKDYQAISEATKNKITPLFLPSRTKTTRPFSLLGNKDTTVPLFREIASNWVKEGVDTIVEPYAGAYTIAAHSLDLAVKNGLRRYFANLFDKQTYLVVKALQEGQISQILGDVDASVRIIDHLILKGAVKEPEVFAIFQTFKKENPGSYVGSDKWLEFINKFDISAEVTIYKDTYNKFRKIFQDVFNELSTRPVTDIRSAVSNAVIKRIGVFGGKGQSLLRINGFAGLEEKIYGKFGMIDGIKDVYRSFRRAKEKGVEIQISNEDGVAFLNRIAPELEARKTGFFMDPPYVKSAKTYENLEGLQNFSSGRNFVDSHSAAFNLEKQGARMALTNDVDEEYINTILNSLSKSNQKLYAYKEQNTPTSLITTSETYPVVLDYFKRVAQGGRVRGFVRPELGRISELIKSQKLPSAVLTRIKKELGIKELKNATEAQLDRVIDELGTLRLYAKNKIKNIRGDVDLVIQDLKRIGVSDAVIAELKVNEIPLTDLLKVKREPNKEISAVILRDEMTKLKAGYKKPPIELSEKWVSKKSPEYYIRQFRNFIHGYELPALYFDRIGLNWIYDYWNEAIRATETRKIVLVNKLSEAGFFKKAGWFTPDRFNLSKSEAEQIQKYFLTRQDKNFSVRFADLTPREQEMATLWDEFLQGTEDEFLTKARQLGHDVEKVPNYSPLYTKEEITALDQGVMPDYIVLKHPGFKSLKPRIFGVPLSLYELDFRKVAAGYIHNLFRFLDIGPVTNRLKYLIDSEEFQVFIRREDLANIQKWYQDITLPAAPATEAAKTITNLSRWGRKMVAYSNLGLNYATVLKQYLTLIFSGIVDKVPPKLQSRFARAFGIDVADLPAIVSRKGQWDIADLQGRIGRLFTGAISKADQNAAQMVIKGYLDQEYARYLKSGAEVTLEVQQLILKFAQDRVENLFGPMVKGKIPLFFRSELGKFLNVFLLPLTSQLNTGIATIARAHGWRAGQKTIEVLTALAIIAYLEIAISNLSFKWSDKKKMIKDTLSSLASNIPILSQIIYAINSGSELQGSAVFTQISRFLKEIHDYAAQTASSLDVMFAGAELFGLPKSIRRGTEGAVIIKEGGRVSEAGKLLYPMTDIPEMVRTVLRGKYGSLKAQDYARNLQKPRWTRQWAYPDVEFLQNGNYANRARLWRDFDQETKKLLYDSLSENQITRLTNMVDELSDYDNQTLDQAKKITQELMSLNVAARKVRYEGLTSAGEITEDIDYLISLFAQ
jgi:hypothetical protein